ncbi:MAG: TolC family protein, partial [Burkholderiales bacterium]|nr:TolC family protein [Burkholderiales bacterium]
MRRAAFALAALGGALVAGCALQSPPTRQDLQAQAMPHTAVPPGWTAGAVTAQPAADRWLATFDDPALTALVHESIAHNADLQAAAARVEQAGGYLKVASSALRPSIGLAGLWSGAASSGGDGLNGVFLNLQLELDVWGRLRYAEAAAQAQADAVAADYAFARQSLAATVAKAWFVAIEAGLQRALLQQMLGTAQQLQTLAEDRQRIGPGNELAVAEARASVAGFRDALRQAELARQNALRAIELLAG